MPKSLSASFLALVPKVENLLELEDYKLICLIGSMYKVVSKILTSRLKKILGKLVSPRHTDFHLPERFWMV